MISAELCRAAHEAALASMDEGQRAAMRQVVDATCMSRFLPETVERRLDAAFRREAASVNRQLAEHQGA